MDIDVKAPILILPFTPHNDVNDQCWVYYTGDLLVLTDPQVFENQDIIYDMYNISINNIRMQYFKSIKFYYECEQEKRQEKFVDIGQQEITAYDEAICVGQPGMFNLVEDFSVEIGIKVMLPEVKKIDFENPQTIIDVKIP